MLKLNKVCSLSWQKKLMKKKKLFWRDSFALRWTEAEFEQAKTKLWRAEIRKDSILYY